MLSDKISRSVEVFVAETQAVIDFRDDNGVKIILIAIHLLSLTFENSFRDISPILTSQRIHRKKFTIKTQFPRWRLASKLESVCATMKHRYKIIMWKSYNLIEIYYGHSRAIITRKTNFTRIIYLLIRIIIFKIWKMFCEFSKLRFTRLPNHPNDIQLRKTLNGIRGDSIRSTSLWNRSRPILNVVTLDGPWLAYKHAYIQPHYSQFTSFKRIELILTSIQQPFKS